MSQDAAGHAVPAGPAALVESPYPKRILDRLAADGDRTVIEHGERMVTGPELLGIIRRVVAGLRAAGIGPGDGVAVALGVSPEAFGAILAGYVVGARVVGVRPGLTADQLRHILGQEITAVLVDPSTAAHTLRAAAGGTTPLAVGAVPGVPDLTSASDDDAALEPAGRPGDIARIIYTSGSTGDPKGCAQTYAALGAGWTTCPPRWPPAIRDLATRLRRYLLFGSLSSQVMMEYAVLTLTAGGTLVIADPTAAGSPGTDSSRGRPFFSWAIAHHGATASLLTVPRLHQLVAAQRGQPMPIDTLRALIVSGSPLEPGRLATALDVLGPVVYHGYGQTETGMISMLTPTEIAESSARLASVGRPPRAVTVEVRDPSGRPVPAGATGELFVRTPGRADGYWAAPAETAEVFVDGWVRTRDLGFLDDDGYLHLIGRIRDVVIVHANLYYIGPIERALAADPDVAEAYVVAAPDEETGEAAHAFVIPENGRRPDPELLRDLVRERCGAACTPRSITLIDTVPITPAGKPDKRALRRDCSGERIDRLVP